MYAALLVLSVPISFRDNTQSGQDSACYDLESPDFATQCYHYLNDITKQFLQTAVSITCVLVITIPLKIISNYENKKVMQNGYIRKQFFIQYLIQFVFIVDFISFCATVICLGRIRNISRS